MPRKILIVTIGVLVLLVGALLAYKTWQEGGLRQGSSQSQTPVSKISGWKVYQNEKYGYRLDYPSDWLILEQERFGSGDKDRLADSYGIEGVSKLLQRITITSPLSKSKQAFGFEVVIYSNPEKSTIESWLSDYFAFSPPEKFAEKVLLDAIPAWKTNIGGTQIINLPNISPSNGVEVTALYNDKIYVVRYTTETYTAPGGPRSVEHRLTTEKIASTFEFLR